LLILVNILKLRINEYIMSLENRAKAAGKNVEGKVQETVGVKM
jgi:hypothetical protein